MKKRLIVDLLSLALILTIIGLFTVCSKSSQVLESNPSSQKVKINKRSQKKLDKQNSSTTQKNKANSIQSSTIQLSSQTIDSKQASLSQSTTEDSQQSNQEVTKNSVAKSSIQVDSLLQNNFSTITGKWQKDQGDGFIISQDGQVTIYWMENGIYKVYPGNKIIVQTQSSTNVFIGQIDTEGTASGVYPS